MPDGATLFVNLASSQIYEMNASASRLWSLLREGRTVEEVATAILDEFDVSPERLADETERLLREWAGAGLAEPVESR